VDRTRLTRGRTPKRPLFPQVIPKREDLPQLPAGADHGRPPRGQGILASHQPGRRLPAAPRVTLRHDQPEPARRPVCPTVWQLARMSFARKRACPGHFADVGRRGQAAPTSASASESAGVGFTSATRVSSCTSVSRSSGCGRR
jgi:hypothetical protein